MDIVIEFPTYKLSSLTKSVNKLAKSLRNDNSSTEQVDELRDNVYVRYDEWINACRVEQSKNLSTFDKTEFNTWFKKHEKRYNTKMKEIESLQNQTNGDEEDDSAEEEDEDSDCAGEEEDDVAGGEDGRGSKGTVSDKDLKSVIAELVRLQATSKLPSHEPPVFNGDISAYRNFMLSFNRIIEKTCSNDDDKYYYLLKYTTGEAHNLVNSCFSKNSKKALDKAKKVLERQYGDQYKQAEIILQKIADWKPIRGEHAGELRAYASFLTSCLNMMDEMSALNQLNSWRDIRDITMVLPYDLRKKFRSQVQRKIRYGREVKFKDVVEFINLEAELASIPVLGNISNDRGRSSNRQGGKSFFTAEPPEQRVTTKLHCEYCKKEKHTISFCRLFLQKTLPERSNIVKSLKLCFGCLTPGHQSKSCINKLECKKCNKLHPTCLHREQQCSDTNNESSHCVSGEDESSGNMMMTVRTKEKIACPAIPVIIRNKVNNETATTYIALDSCSTSCYMDENLMNQLGFNSHKKDLEVTTINGRTNCMRVKVVENLEIISLDRDYRLTIPRLYAKRNWPFCLADSPKNEDVASLQLKEDVPFKFVNKPIGILVGMNVPEILKPLKIISTTRKGPYITLHTLGYALNGPLAGNSPLSRCFGTLSSEIQEDSTSKNSAGMVVAGNVPDNLSSLIGTFGIKLDTARQPRLAEDIFVTPREELRIRLNIQDIRLWMTGVVALQPFESERLFVANQVTHVRSIASLSEYHCNLEELNPADLTKEEAAGVASFAVDTLRCERPKLLSNAEIERPQPFTIEHVNALHPELMKLQRNLAVEEEALADCSSIVLGPTLGLFKFKYGVFSFVWGLQLLPEKPLGISYGIEVNKVATYKDFNSVGEQLNSDCPQQYSQSRNIGLELQSPQAFHFVWVLDRQMIIMEKMFSMFLIKHHKKTKRTLNLLSLLLCRVEITTLWLVALIATSAGCFVGGILYVTYRRRRGQFRADLFWYRYRKKNSIFYIFVML